MGEKRVTAHSRRGNNKGKTFRARHNDRSAKCERGEHIDRTRESLNAYWNCLDKNMDFGTVERTVYQELFGDGLEKKNARYIAQGHAERVKTVTDMLEGNKTAPLETILQLGKIEHFKELSSLAGGDDMARAIMRQVLWDAIVFLVESLKPYTGNIKLLDIALHMDEQTPHIHARQCFFYENERGERVLGQEQALKRAGFELPNPGKAEGRYNNRLMSYSVYMRESWIKSLQRSIDAFGRENPHMEHVTDYLQRMELTPQEVKRPHLEKNDYIIQEQKRKMHENTQALEKQKKEKALLEKEISDLEKQKSRDKRLRIYEKEFCRFVDEAERERERGRGRGR